jgi:hypothetical protein
MATVARIEAVKNHVLLYKITIYSCDLVQNDVVVI